MTLAGDPVSAFGGVLITNGKTVDEAAAEEINKIFFEVIIAPTTTTKGSAILEQKKNRIVLVQHCPNTSTAVPLMPERWQLGQERRLALKPWTTSGRLQSFQSTWPQINLLFAKQNRKTPKAMP